MSQTSPTATRPAENQSRMITFPFEDSSKSCKNEIRRRRIIDNIIIDNNNYYNIDHMFKIGMIGGYCF